MNFGLTPPHHFLEEIYKSVFDIDGPEYQGWTPRPAGKGVLPAPIQILEHQTDMRSSLLRPYIADTSALLM